MPLVEILDGPPEWAGVVYETDEDMVADEIGLTHPRWVGTPLASYRALYAYRKVEVAGDRHRYRYQGPWPQWRHRHGLGEDLTGWDVLVVQQELHSDDPRKLWGSPVRVYAAPPGTPRPDPARAPEEQGWQELLEGGRLRRRHPRAGTYLQEVLAARMREGDPWVAEHWRRLASKQGAAKDADAELIEDDHLRRGRLAGAARELRRLRPDAVRSWTGDPPFAGRTTYVPVIGEYLAAIPGMVAPEWVAMQDRVLLVVHPEPESEDAPVFGSARVYGAPPGTPPPDPLVAPEQQGWTELEEGDFLVAWLLHIRRVDV
jgi:hypothetical protein